MNSYQICDEIGRVSIYFGTPIFCLMLFGLLDDNNRFPQQLYKNSKNSVKISAKIASVLKTTW